MGAPNGHAFERTIETVERDREIAFYKQGRTYDDVAKHFKVSKSSAHAAVQRAIAEAIKPIRTDLIGDELLKLDAMEIAAWQVLRSDHITVSDGRVVRDQDHVITDDGPILEAIRTLLRIAERRAKLLGLDAPARQTITVISEDAVDAELRRLEEEIAEADNANAAGRDRSTTGETSPTA